MLRDLGHDGIDSGFLAPFFQSFVPGSGFLALGRLKGGPVLRNLGHDGTASGFRVLGSERYELGSGF